MRSLRVLGLLCIGLPLLVYAGVGTFRYQQIQSETRIRLDRTLRIAQEHAQKLLDINETVLARVLDTLAMQSSADIASDQAGIHAKLRPMSENKPHIHAIWVLDAQGRPLASDRTYPVPSNVDASDRSYFKHHQSGQRGLFLSEPLKGRLTGATFFDLSRGRFDADGRFAGVVSISFPPAYFEKFHSDLAAEEPGLAITMLREDGTVLTRWPPLPDAPATLSATSPVMTLIREGRTSGTTTGVSSIDGRERLLSFIKVGEFPVFVGTGMETGRITRRWIEEMLWLAAFGLPFLIALLVAARTVLRRTRESLAAADALHEEMAARRRVEDALFQAQKLEALGRLTGGVAHDFNNALMVISNNLYLLKRQHPQADGAPMASIARAVGSATQLTRQLLAFSRRQALVPEYIRLQDRLPTFMELLKPVLGAQIGIDITVSLSTRPIYVDAAELELAMLNLAINSRDAMPSGGRFRIDASHSGEVTLPYAGGPFVVIEVGDTGCGIAPDLIDKVFEPFFTTKPVGEGTGLGLSQVYALCQTAGGHVTIKSTVGKGTVVHLYFPAKDPVTVAPVQAAQALPTDLGLSILLVEDNDLVAGALQPVLETFGCTVVRAATAMEAATRLAAGERPDLMLSDIVMPGDMDGLALGQAVRARYPAVRIILMSGYAKQLDAIAAQGFNILPKPCSAELLAAAIAKAFNTSKP